MQRFFILSFIGLVLLACKMEKGDSLNQEQPISAESPYPIQLQDVFKAHGGLDHWKTKNGLTFGMQRPNGTEVTLTNLKSRHSLIETPTYKLGYNGTDLWLKETDTIPYNGNARFYNGLMFYFYAMPFVLADEGIIYEEVEPLNFNGVTYPGILVSYKNGVGVSPEDQYILYYHPETKQMSWLAYTVTYGKDEKSTNFRFIEYHDWQSVEGLKLPKAISWYTVEDGQPVEKRNPLEFIDVSLSEEAPEAKLFEPMERSEIIE